MSPDRPSRRQVVIGWLAVVGTILIAGFWAFWGIIENFHEGWYHHHLGKNFAMLFGQYLSAMLLFIFAGLLALKWPVVGAVLHLAGVVFVLSFFSGAHPQVLATFCVPLVLLAFGYLFGRTRPKRWAYRLVVGVPLLVMIACGLEPAIRVSGRIDDMDRGARRITAEGVDLIWAPTGSGWPLENGNVTWEEANKICRHLSTDGNEVLESPQDIWRLPTVEEFVRSQLRHGENCGGTWDPEAAKPKYDRRPDKESPLWATDSKIIYWWLGTEVDSGRAYKATYQGMVRPAKKDSPFSYWGFRAVKPAASP
jgi:hypothetical protein